MLPQLHGLASILHSGSLLNSNSLRKGFCRIKMIDSDVNLYSARPAIIICIDMKKMSQNL